MINLPTDLTIDSCEDFVAGLQKTNQDEALYLPSELSNSLFGGVAAAIQAVNTWGRFSNSREIILGGQSEDIESYLGEIVNRPHKFSAAMLAKKILISSSNLDIRGSVNLAASDAIENQAASKHGQQRGALCWFSFVDHSTKVSIRIFIQALQMKSQCLGNFPRSKISSSRWWVSPLMSLGEHKSFQTMTCMIWDDCFLSCS